jgi:hypothetical protein
MDPQGRMGKPLDWLNMANGGLANSKQIDLKEQSESKADRTNRSE